MTHTAAVVPSATAAVRPVSAVPPMPGASSHDDLLNALLDRFRTDLIKLGVPPARIPRELMEPGPRVRWPLKPVKRRAK